MFSPVSSGKSVEAVALAHQPEVLAEARSSLKRLPERATSVRLMTTCPPLCGFVARRHTPSPSWKPLPSARVISWSNQSESSASFAT